jgi:fructose-bisphosphate aldolase, class II
LTPSNPPVLPDTAALVRSAWQAKIAIPAFNIPELPMMAPVAAALRDTECAGLIQVARLEWVKFGARSLAAVREEYERCRDERFMRLHLDHVPVIDEDGLRVDYLPILKEALDLGYQSVMVDGSRLSLDENIAATRLAAELAHGAGVPIEGELGAVMGHEAGPLPPYEELFASGRGFTDPQDAARFVRESGVDWLSVAVGNVHGAITAASLGKQKVEARLSIERLDRIGRSAGVPLVLHGGSGIRKECVLDGVRHGIAKINIGTAIRQPYLKLMGSSIVTAQEAVYRETVRIVREELEIAHSARRLAKS